MIDRWVLAELDHVVTSVGNALENFDTAGSGRVLAQFIDDLLNWYVRRCRARFWNGDRDALATLRECLHVLTRLLAPFVPFITEQVWQHAIKPGDASVADSVHLAAWPTPDATRSNDELRANMDITRQLVEVGRAVRKTAKFASANPCNARWSVLREQLRYINRASRSRGLFIRAGPSALCCSLARWSLGRDAVTVVNSRAPSAP